MKLFGHTVKKSDLAIWTGLVGMLGGMGYVYYDLFKQQELQQREYQKSISPTGSQSSTAPTQTHFYSKISSANKYTK